MKVEGSFTATTTPSETETEAANILTTIKSGELIANQQQCFELLSEFESTTASGIEPTFVQKIEVDGSQAAAPKVEQIDPSTVSIIKSQNGDEINFLASDDDLFKNFTSGPLDALASAALQASTNQQLQTTTTTVKKAEITSPLTTSRIETKKPLKITPKEEVNIRISFRPYRCV